MKKYKAKLIKYMKATYFWLWAALGIQNLPAQTPTELRAKALELLASGKDNEALGVVQQLLRTETPSDKGLPAVDLKKTKTGPPSAFASLSKHGFRLQREPGPSSDAKPAEFSFTRTYGDGGGTAYGADFFLGWNPAALSPGMSLELSAQGKLHTGDEAKDAWIFRISGENISQPLGLDGLHTTFSLKEESDRNFDYNRVAGEISLTPTLKRAAIGQYRPIADRDPKTGMVSEDLSQRPAFQFRWRPYVGGDFGTWLGGVPTEENETSARAFARVTADIRLNWLAAVCNLEDAALFVDETACFTDGVGNHSYLKTGLNLMFSENVGFGLTFKVGEDAPVFAKERLLTGALTVKF